MKPLIIPLQKTNTRERQRAFSKGQMEPKKGKEEVYSQQNSNQSAIYRYNSKDSTSEDIKKGYSVETSSGSSSPGDSIGDSKTKSSRITDWNAEFQDVMNLPNGEQKSLLLASIIKDFHFNARKFGEVIISEKCLPVTKKTIKPVSLGGLPEETFATHFYFFFLPFLTFKQTKCRSW